MSTMFAREALAQVGCTAREMHTALCHSREMFRIMEAKGKVQIWIELWPGYSVDLKWIDNAIAELEELIRLDGDREG
jgi:hypothetical protein